MVLAGRGHAVERLAERAGDDRLAVDPRAEDDAVDRLRGHQVLHRGDELRRSGVALGDAHVGGARSPRLPAAARLGLGAGCAPGDGRRRRQHEERDDDHGDGARTRSPAVLLSNPAHMGREILTIRVSHPNSTGSRGRVTTIWIVAMTRRMMVKIRSVHGTL